MVSSQGNRYIMIKYKRDGNLILVEPMKTRSSGNMCRSYNKLIAQLTESGIKVMKHSIRRILAGDQTKRNHI